MRGWRAVRWSWPPSAMLCVEGENRNAREIIETAFLNYDGAILAVSHDRYFIKKLAQRMLKVTDGTIKEMVVKN